jgi:hypothetical protein
MIFVLYYLKFSYILQNKNNFYYSLSYSTTYPGFPLCFATQLCYRALYLLSSRFASGSGNDMTLTSFNDTLLRSTRSPVVLGLMADYNLYRVFCAMFLGPNSAFYVIHWSIPQARSKTQRLQLLFARIIR